jgi:hydroxymethylpyrimidine/phosphomethylpyrimidine kinase
MSANRPFALTIAGFDPSAGAGVLADVKTFEQHQTYGLAITTGSTIQTENEFFEMQWTDIDFVLRSITVLFSQYKIGAVKIGIVPTLAYLKDIVFTIKKLSPKTKIVWDPVLKSTTDFDFMKVENQNILTEILKNINLITPNYYELRKLFPNFISEELWLKNSIATAILFKGGHNALEIGTDYLFINRTVTKLLPNIQNGTEKHGSGCVLSSAITANLVLEQDLITACTNAKKYIEKYLNSTNSLIGYHYV